MSRKIYIIVALIIIFIIYIHYTGYILRIVSLLRSNYTGQQRFWPMRKNVSDVFLDAEFEYVSRISLSLTPFALHQTM